MKKTELLLLIVIVGLGGGFWMLSRQSAELADKPQPKPQPTPAVQETEVALAPIIFDQSTPSKGLKPTSARKPKPATPADAQNPQPGNSSQEPLHDPDAREALAMVGADPLANQYWMDAIFDTSLPDNERADLMEDLNETGFDDPKNLTSDDVPLIVSRLVLIDTVLPDADDFMKEHLFEAQKDLTNMLSKASQ
jgi:hypothetical protein